MKCRERSQKPFKVQSITAMAAIDFNKMMAEELAKAKAHALKSNKLESKGRQNYETMRNDADNARRAFMDKRLEIGVMNDPHVLLLELLANHND